jgi:nitrate/TMAO reductase-like tetraheme cytochrome c subunit
MPAERLPGSVHQGFYCTVCHPGAQKLPHENPLDPAACANCHSDIAREYQGGVHGSARDEGVPDVPSCADCHGGHDILPKDDPQSKIFPFNIPKTCGQCHGNEKLAADHHIPVPKAYQQYLESVHGQGLLQSGLLVAATCVDCHGAHDIRPNDDPNSLLYRTNVPRTCSLCHLGVLQEYERSVHGKIPPDRGPVCTDCHRTHAIQPPREQAFRLASVLACAECHPDSFETYRESYHGQVSALGYAGVATCADCHGNHLILPAEDPDSTLSPQSIVATCQKCHPYANENYVQFLPHVRPNDPRSTPPILYGTWLFMTILLLVVFGVFGAHTLLWIVRGYLVPALAPITRRRPPGGEEDGHGPGA